ncbi:MAG: nucleotidyltransferase domain-containing protein [Nitrososphaerales archaeon]
MHSFFKISRIKCIESLRQLLNGYDVVLAYLFGSVAEGFSAHDVNLALKLRSKEDFSIMVILISEIARALKVPENKVDIVDIEKAGLP